MKPTTVKGESERAWLRPALLGGLLLGFGLRIHRLGAESLWYDETVSVYLARLPFGEMLAHTAGDIHPPGYYALLHAWQALSRPTLTHGLEFLYAWPSLWAGMLVLALLYPVGRRLFGRPTATLAVWLAAVNPFHLWYSQEVRMYTLGAALALLCLWATLRYFDGGARAWRWLLVYAPAAAAGLYSLYYFAFPLLGLNTLALVELFHRNASGKDASRKQQERRRAALGWIGAQLAVVALWLPWLPIFIRQALNPPVPPWRMPWETPQALLASVSETLGALITGQTPPGGQMWPYALVALLTIAIFALWPAQDARAGRARRTLLIVLLVPIGALYLLSALVTPLYHVRYIFLFAPPFMLLSAAVILGMARRVAWPALAALAAVLIISLAGLSDYWRNPAYRADDHRTAVAELARAWRPGDAILVNAGWLYPALEVYWPTELVGPLATRPRAIGWDGRFTLYAEELNGDGLGDPRRDSATPVVLARTGSVDGDPTLGWGDPASDFFAVSTEETTAALVTMAAAHPRLWHYRLYDTVSDPAGVIRTWLDDNATLAEDLPYAGRDFLRVQRFDMPAAKIEAEAENDEMNSPTIPVDARFGDALLLVGRDAHTPVEAGETFYVNLYWTALEGLGNFGTDLSMSLRLYEYDSDLLLAQQDVAPQPSTASWRPGAVIRQSLAVPVPASAKPLRYAIELVVYRQDTGEPLPPASVAGDDQAHVIAGQRWRIGLTDVFKPPYPPALTDPPLARFDYIDLAHVALDRAQTQPGNEFRAELIWLPRAGDYRDNYNVIIELRDANDETIAAWSQVAGGLNYPSSVWPPGYPLREVRVMPLPTDVAPGAYTVTLRLARASDRLPIPASSGRWDKHAFVEIGKLRVE